MIGESDSLLVAEDGCHQYSLSQLTTRVNYLLSELDKIRNKTLNINNSIFITRTLGKIDNYALAIIILLMKLNEPEAFRVVL